mgnify:CR=1 FL=1
MTDYVKISLKDIDINRLENLPELDFKIEVSEKTGEISTKKTADYHFCKVVIYDSGLVLFNGSIHKLWNSLHKVNAPNYKEVKQYKGFNGNQFAINDIVKVRQHLETLFNCEPQQMIFQNIEFGINTTPVFNPQLFLKGLLYHNGKPFEFRHKEHFAQAIHQRYYFKIYNKSNQYGMQEHTLRVELKLIASDQFAPLGIKTFADINTSTLNKAKELLLKRFDEVVYYDNTIVKESLSERQKQTLERYSNPRYWIDTLTKQNRLHHKNRLKEFILNYSANLHQQIKQNIEQKCIIINQENGVIINHNSKLKKEQNTLPITSVSENINTLPITSSSIGVISTNNTPKKQGRKCRVTRVDISMQKEGSILLSHTGLKYYYKTNKKEFEKIKNKYLSKKWIDANFETQIKELAHNIRNKHNNLKNSREQKYHPNQVQLFESVV